MVDVTQPTDPQQAAAPPLLAPSTNVASAPADVPAATYDSSAPQAQVASDVAAEPNSTPQSAPVKQSLSYQDQITKLQKAGFSGDEIQDYSINQAIKLRQAGFNQDEVDAYQGMKPPAVPGGTPIYGHVPTDKRLSKCCICYLGRQ